MKKLFIGILAIVAIANTTLLSAQDTTINLAKAGTLSTILSATTTKFQSLKLTGVIDAQDFRTMRNLTESTLKKIDLASATIVAYSGSKGTTRVKSSAYTNAVIEDYNTSYYANVVPNHALSASCYMTQAYKNTVLEEIILPTTCKKIDKCAFLYCIKLKSITLNKSITDIGYASFWQCSLLDSIRFYAASTFDGEIFDKNTNLKKIIFTDTLASTTYTKGVTYIGGLNASYPYWSLPTTCKIYVPCGCKNIYAAISPLSKNEIVDVCKAFVDTTKKVDVSISVKTTKTITGIETKTVYDTVVKIDSVAKQLLNRSSFGMFQKFNSTISIISTKDSAIKISSKITKSVKFVDSVQKYSITDLQNNTTKVSIETTRNFLVDSVENYTINNVRITLKDSSVVISDYSIYNVKYDSIFFTTKNYRKRVIVDTLFSVIIDTTKLLTTTSTITTKYIDTTSNILIKTLVKNVVSVADLSTKTNTTSHVDTTITTNYVFKQIDNKAIYTKDTVITSATINHKVTDTKILSTVAKKTVLNSRNQSTIATREIIINKPFIEVSKISTSLSLNDFIAETTKIYTANDEIASNDLVIYPTIATNYITTNDNSIVIVNVAGEVQNISFVENTIDVSNFANGTYVIKSLSSNKTVKFVKQ